MSQRISHHGVVVGAGGSSSSRVAVRWGARAAAMRHVPIGQHRRLLGSVSTGVDPASPLSCRGDSRRGTVLASIVEAAGGSGD